MERPEILMDVSRLTGDVSLELFNSTIRERTFRQFKSAFDEKSVSALFGLNVLESLLTAERVPATYIDVITGGLPKRLTDLQRGSDKSTLAMVSAALRRGATIRVSDIQRFHPALEEFIQGVRVGFAARAQANVYLTPPQRGGFEPHFDTTDIFIVQCLGAKEWTLFNDYVGRIELPLLDTPWDPDRYCPSSDAERLTLTRGDTLYLPRGVMHQARCAEESSLHLTISIAPLSTADVLLQEIRRLAEADVVLRRRLEWSFDDAIERSAALELDVRRSLCRLIESVDVRAVLAAEQARLQTPLRQAPQAAQLQAAIADSPT